MPADARHALAEGDLLLLRFVDLGLLACDHEGGNAHSSVEVYKQGGFYRLRAAVDGRPLQLSRGFIEQVLWNFWTVADIASMLMAFLESVRQLGGGSPEDWAAVAAPEIPTLTGFAYRGSGGSAEPIVVSELSDLSRFGVSVPFRDLEEIAAGTGQVAISAVIERHGSRLQMRPDRTEAHG